MCIRDRGETIVRDTHHISRGHEDLVGKLQSLGADVDWVPGA